MFKKIINRHEPGERSYDLTEDAKLEFNRIDADFKDKSDDR